MSFPVVAESDTQLKKKMLSEKLFEKLPTRDCRVEEILVLKLKQIPQPFIYNKYTSKNLKFFTCRGMRTFSTCRVISDLSVEKFEIYPLSEECKFYPQDRYG